MKHGSYWLCIVMICLLMASCKQDNRVELFEMNYFMDFTIDPGLNSIETFFYETNNPPLSTLFQEKLDAADLEAADVIAIEPKFATLSAIFGDIDLDFIEEVSVHVLDPFDQNAPREVFYLEFVPFNTGTVIRPFPGLQNVKNVMQEKTFIIQLRLKYRTITPREVDMRLEIDLSAKGE